MSDPVLVSYEIDRDEMRQRGKLGALVLHSRHDSRVTTVAAREAFRKKFEIEVDPNLELPEAERQRRAEYARKAYFQRLAMASAKARKARAHQAD